MIKVKLRMYKGLFPLFLGMGELIYGNENDTVTVKLKLKETTQAFASDDERLDFIIKEAFEEVKRKIDSNEFDEETRGGGYKDYE
jgi:hypothetical protein